MKIKVLCLSVLAVSALGFKYKEDVKTLGLKFVAPSVHDKNSVALAEEGEIVFEVTETGRKFFGRANGQWVPLSAGQSVIPSGVIMPYGGVTVPDGYLFAEGQALLVADYGDLYSAIGPAYGNGSKNADGTLTGYPEGTAFNLPDMRGRFMRGVDGTAGRDSGGRVQSNEGGNTGNLIGSLQDDEIKSHKHRETWVTSTSLPSLYLDLSNGYYSVPGTLTVLDKTGTAFTNNIQTNSYPTGGGETRPKNVNVKYIIKQ